jgi:hypothetical protein
VLGNPVSLVDPDGRSPDWIKTTNDDGTETYTAEQGDSAKSLEEQHGISFEVGNAAIQGLYGSNIPSDKPEGRSNIKPGDQITLVAILTAEPAISSGSSGGGLLSDIVDWLGNILPGSATSSSEGDQQQHSGDSYTIYAVGSSSGYSINAPTADPSGANKAIDISGVFPLGGGLPSFVNPIKGINSLSSKTGSAIERARNTPSSGQVIRCTGCGATLELGSPKSFHPGFDTINRQ